MALLEDDEQGDLMPILGTAYDTLLELDEEGDLMPRLDPQPGSYPDPRVVRKGVMYGPEDEFVGEFGNISFTTKPETLED